MQLAKEGADVGINDIVRDSAAEHTVREVERLGSKVSWHQANVGNSDDINRMMDEFEAEHGGIDIVVNNAVASVKNSFLDITEMDWDLEIDNALKGPFLLSQRAAKKMVAQRRGGRIISISSVHAFWAQEYNLVYGVAKAGLVRMAMSMAVDLAGHDITCNVVAPGLIDSRVLSAEDEHLRAGSAYAPDTAERVPLRRPGVPDDIANMVGYLCSDAANYITGQTFTVDGGMSIVAPTPIHHVPGTSNMSEDEVESLRT